MNTIVTEAPHRRGSAHHPIVNKATLWLLRSPARRLLDAKTCVVTYASRDGRAIVLPAQYAELEGDTVVLVGQPEAKTWWRHFREPAPADIQRRGHRGAHIGRLVEGDEAISLTRRYLDRHPSARRALGLERRWSGTELIDAVNRVQIVRFSPAG